MDVQARRLILVPRMSGSPRSDWYPWLERQLRSHAPQLFDEVIVPAMPRPAEPVIEEWVETLAPSVGSDSETLARTVLVGHSVGCLAALHYLQTLSAGARLGGVLCVAGWWWVDRPWDALVPWIETPLDLERVRAVMGTCVSVISDDDPFVEDTAANTRAWQEKLGAKVVVVRGAQHFNGAQQPAVFRALVEMCGGEADA